MSFTEDAVHPSTSWLCYIDLSVTQGDIPSSRVKACCLRAEEDCNELAALFVIMQTTMNTKSSCTIPTLLGFEDLLFGLGDGERTSWKGRCRRPARHPPEPAPTPLPVQQLSERRKNDEMSYSRHKVMERGSTSRAKTTQGRALS